jgi:hypothetical protein
MTLPVASRRVISREAVGPFLTDAQRALLQYQGYAFQKPFRDGVCFVGEETVDGEAHLRACYTAGDETRTVLWGDSHGAHLYPGLRALEPGLVQLNASGCPPFRELEVEDRPRCRGYNRTIGEMVAARRPTRVILAANWWRYQSAHIEVVTQLDLELTRLARDGVSRVVVIGQLPLWERSLPLLLFAATPRDRAFPRRLAIGRVQGVIALDREMRAHAERAGATYVSLIDGLCTSEGCATYADGADLPLQWDSDHLSAEGSAWIAEQVIRPAVVSAWPTFAARM